MTTRLRLRCAVAAVSAALAAVAVTGCSGAAAGPGETRLVVLAASSLTVPFETLAQRFETDHPGVDVVVSYGSSATLAGQVSGGFPADVFAAASEATMAPVVEAGATAGRPVPFAANRLAIAVPPGNPAQLRSVTDLARPGVTVAVCQPEAPCGTAASQLFTRAGLTVRPATLEPDVRAVLGKVRLGEVDAGLVYASDVTSAGEAVATIPLARRHHVTSTYPIAVLAGAPQPRLAEAFVALVTSATGQQALRRAGFGSAPPPEP